MSKTLLFSPMWLDAPDGVERHTKWLDFILPLKAKLGYDHLYFVDNASSMAAIDDLVMKYKGKFLIHRFKTHIARREHLKYGYWYAALAQAGKFAIEHDFDKIIYIDTDMYPLSNKICDYVRTLEAGWVGMYCHKHNFPETNFQVICKDQLQKFYDFHSRDFLVFYPDKDAESQTPFTLVNKDFVGDRYAEFNEGQGVDQTPDMDYFGQYDVKSGRVLKFGG